MRIIIDTNIWISFTIGKKLSTLKSLLNSKQVEIYVCEELIAEYKDVVARPKLKKYISEKDIFDTLELMSLYCLFVDIEKQAVSPIRDAKDLYLLSLADTIPADYIVSGDKDLLVLERHNETRILDYTSFLALL